MHKHAIVNNKRGVFPLVHSETHRRDRRARHRISAPREPASHSTAARRGEPGAVLRVDLEAQQAMWPQGCYQAERHIASSTLRAGTGTGLGLGCQAGSFWFDWNVASLGLRRRRGNCGHSFQGTSLVRAHIWRTQWREWVNS